MFPARLERPCLDSVCIDIKWEGAYLSYIAMAGAPKAIRELKQQPLPCRG